MKPQRVIYGKGAQPLYFAPHDELARPAVASDPAYSLVDPRYSTDSADYLVASGTPTVSSANGALTSDAGPTEADARLIVVDSATGITAGRRYLLAGDDGKKELVTVAAVDGLNVYALHDLRNEYSSGAASLLGIELQATFPSSEANDEDNLEDGDPYYQIVWTYTIDGRTFVSGETVILSRYSSAPWIDERDVLEYYPSMAQRARGRFSIASAINVATRDIVAKMEAIGKDTAYYRFSEPGSVAAAKRSIYYLLRWQGKEEEADDWRKEYEDLMANISSGQPPQHTKELSTIDDKPVNPKARIPLFDGS